MPVLFGRLQARFRWGLAFPPGKRRPRWGLVSPGKRRPRWGLAFPNKRRTRWGLFSPEIPMEQRPRRCFTSVIIIPRSFPKIKYILIMGNRFSGKIADEIQNRHLKNSKCLFCLAACKRVSVGLVFPRQAPSPLGLGFSRQASPPLGLVFPRKPHKTAPAAPFFVPCQPARSRDRTSTKHRARFTIWGRMG